MTEASKRFQLEMSPGMSEFTSSQALEDGSSLSESPAGKGECGLGRVHVSRFRAQDSEKAMPTNDISGPLFTASSPSADLQWCLGKQVASKDGREWFAAVRADLERLGYACGGADMPGCGRRGAAHPAAVMVGGRLPSQPHRIHCEEQAQDPMVRKAGGHQVGLQDAVRLVVGWPSPQASSGGPEPEGTTGRKLSTVAGWASLGFQAPSSPAPMEKRGPPRNLNPAFSCWLMGVIYRLADVQSEIFCGSH